MWHETNNGCSSVRSAYSMVVESDLCKSAYRHNASSSEDHCKCWNKIRKLKIPNKIKHHLWRLATNALPTLSNLQRRRVMTDITCPVCGVGDEVQNHVMFDCVVAVQS
ncbi:hypothetical protein ACH5RR_034357 [Cinchona calisaya]|uniref:Reverse transcriptase zinc-binding domain-containing protein n=1 Tax=Cinchona calisaya TaxID=153742 RepID=A0ABD2YAQ2_9GENT